MPKTMSAKDKMIHDLKVNLVDQNKHYNAKTQTMSRHHVSIMDIGECLTSLGSLSNQIGEGQATQAAAGGIAAGLRRAAYRIEFDTTEGFGDEIKLISEIRAALKSGKHTYDSLSAFISPKENKTTIG